MEDQDKNQIAIKTIPWQIWVVVALLGLEGMGNLLDGHLGWFGAKVLFTAGLLLRWKWVYILFLVIASYHVYVFVGIGMFGVATINLALIILVLWVFRYYFQKQETIIE